MSNLPLHTADTHNTGLLMSCGQARGQIRHRRFMPKSHEFSNQLQYLWLDVDKLAEACANSRLWSLKKFNLLSINPADLLGQGRLPLRDAIGAQVQEKLGQVVLASDSIRVLTLPNSLGFGFNSVSFYFVFRDAQPLFILSEITNTPWNERHTYVFDCLDAQALEASKTKVENQLEGQIENRVESQTESQIKNQLAVQNNVYRFDFDKQFHVSPFMPMQAQYRWHFKMDADQFVIYMQMQQQEKRLFDARISFALKPLSPQQQTLFALKHPLQGVKMLSGIYWQALRLAAKRIPFYRHPKTTVVGENQL